MLRIIFLCSALFIPSLSLAGDIIVVPPLLGSEPNTPSTLTLLYPAAKAQATLILIPGGEGHLRFTEAQKDQGILKIT